MIWHVQQTVVECVLSYCCFDLALYTDLFTLRADNIIEKVALP